MIAPAGMVVLGADGDGVRRNEIVGGTGRVVVVLANGVSTTSGFRFGCFTVGLVFLLRLSTFFTTASSFCLTTCSLV
jgi:hypothetical protein